MALPPYVIIDTNSPGLMLGAYSWTKFRDASLSFDSAELGLTWVREASKNTPGLFTGRKVQIMHIEHTAHGEPPPMQARSDYDTQAGT